VVVAALVQEYGWSWFERARKEGLLVLRSNSDVGRALTSREVGVGMMLDVVAYDLIRDGAPLALVWPEEGAVSFPAPIAITAAAANVAGARLFVDYIISKEGQQAMAGAGWIPVRPDVEPARGRPRASDIKAVRLSFEEVERTSASRRAKFEEIMLR
jgi:iron(III) transport system substrate-binding protein